MNWFEQMCRNMGLMIHNIQHPHGPQMVRKSVEEKRIDQTTTLRRTTIEEIEIRKAPEPPGEQTTKRSI